MSKATLIIILALSVASCVSVKLSPSSRDKRAEGVVVTEPGSPFNKDKRDDVDAAWQNPGNGNVISYLSDCQDPSDPSLDSIVNGVLSGIRELQIESRDIGEHQGRESRRVVATGKVDGVPTQIDLMVFKRNQCIFILSYVGVRAAFAADRDRFSSFVKGFRAP